MVQDRGGGGGVFEHGADQSFLRLYFEKLATSQVATARPLAFDRVGDVATMTMIAGEREAQNSDFYVKWVKPLGFRDVIGVFVLKSGRRVGWFSLARSDVQSRYDDRDLRALGLLFPHVCRALLISDALDLQTIASTRLEETVDGLSTGIFLTEGEHGRITYMNSSAEQLLAGGALANRNGRLTAATAGARDALSRALAASASARRRRRAAGTPLPCPARRAAAWSPTSCRSAGATAAIRWRRCAAARPSSCRIRRCRPRCRSLPSPSSTG